MSISVRSVEADTVFVEERIPLTVYPCVLFAPPPKLTDSMLMDREPRRLA